MNKLEVQQRKIESILRILRNRLVNGNKKPLCFSLNNRFKCSIETLVLKGIFQTTSNRCLFEYIEMNTCGYYLGIAPEDGEKFFTKRIEFLDYLITRSKSIANACLAWDQMRKLNGCPNIRENLVNYVKHELSFDQRALCSILTFAPPHFDDLPEFALLLLDVISKAPEIVNLTNDNLKFFLRSPYSMTLKENKHFRVSLLNSLIYLY